ncbi:geranylgeranyl pyrophosphate synthase [Flexivirga endophytica]|uniref:Geranylgeranyl pyrophosphate synthase n=1 Tax=Flexivirga endophytica TaxID=1849103 RepID=A0A916SXK9_9MICO|nr:polyprenyl synthetase family protein [Flexivirga endophytica]GGB20728.1 geranylgeranyl pyrophosphate synthase [Flexivirga endophytica]GHB58567.1 geranylgeranyl pyrophosphate synthase [Flexivirga endophytica]
MPTADLEDLRARVQRALDEERRTQAAILSPLGPEMADLLDAVFALLSGGKRLRAGFFYWGYRAAGGPDSAALVRAAMSLEVFQAAALLHDDVMDDSDVRRGMPSAHRRLADIHRERGLAGDPGRFGEAGAILAGDLCLNWTDEIYSTSGLPADELARGRRVLDTMRTQLMGGQYLDVVEAAQTWDGVPTEERIERARKVIRFKSAKYTIEHPVLIGATCAGADEATLSALSDYGLALGEAFQLRDDLLGVFGDPEQTGKPAGDDLREGKRTVLIAFALQGMDPADLQRFRAVFGDPDIAPEDVTWLRDQCVRTGAVDQTEKLIAARADAARAALDTARLTADGHDALVELIDISTARSS